MLFQGMGGRGLGQWLVSALLETHLQDKSLAPHTPRGRLRVHDGSRIPPGSTRPKLSVFWGSHSLPTKPSQPLAGRRQRVSVGALNDPCSAGHGFATFWLFLLPDLDVIWPPANHRPPPRRALCGWPPTLTEGRGGGNKVVEHLRTRGRQ